MAGFTKITMGHVKIVASRYGSVNYTMAYVTSKGLHIKLLDFTISIYDCKHIKSRKSIIISLMITHYKKKVERVWIEKR